MRRLLAFMLKVRRVSEYSYTYRALRVLYNTWNERLTRPGKFVAAAAVTTAVAGSFPDATVGSAAFSVFVALIVLSLTFSILRKPRVSVSVHLPERCVAGSSVPLRLTVRNTSGRDINDVGAYAYRLPDRLAIQGDVRYVPRLPPGESHTFEYPLRTRRRGSYTLRGATAVSAFPFGLTQAKRFFAEGRRLIVYPAFHRLTHLDIPVGQRYQPGGIVLTSKVGESMEFVGNREYRPGDRLRDLHVRSWARVGYPVVRQFQEEFLTRVAILVDTHSPEPDSILPPAEGDTRWARFKNRAAQAWGSAPEPPDRPLEAALSLTAAVADHLARQEYIVDLFAAGPELYYFQAGRSLGYLDNILDILACIERCPSDPFDVAAPRLSEELSQISTVILVLLNWDEPRKALVRRIEAAGVEVKLILISDKHTMADVGGVGASPRVVSVNDVRTGIEAL